MNEIMKNIYKLVLKNGAKVTIVDNKDNTYRMILSSYWHFDSSVQYMLFPTFVHSPSSWDLPCEVTLTPIV